MGARIQADLPSNIGRRMEPGQALCKIMTFTGVSGVGKTSLVRRLLVLVPELAFVPNVTTRNPRGSDLNGEYNYVSQAEFERMISANEFIWHICLHDAYYGTTFTAIDSVVQRKAPSAMILAPARVENLHQYARGNAKSFYLLSPPTDEIERRLVSRGDSLETARKRIIECRSWDVEAQGSGLYTILPPADLDTMARSVIEHIGIESGE